MSAMSAMCAMRDMCGSSWWGVSRDTLEGHPRSLALQRRGTTDAKPAPSSGGGASAVILDNENIHDILLDLIVPAYEAVWSDSFSGVFLRGGIRSDSRFSRRWHRCSSPAIHWRARGHTVP